MQFNLGILRIAASFCKCFPASDGFLMSAAFALPDIQRSSPITVTGNCPVLNVLQPVAKTALADGLRNPVDGIIIADQILLDRCLADIPALSCVINQRGITSPAMRIFMLEFRCVKQLALRIQILDNLRICLFNKDSCIRSLFGKFTLAIDKLYKWEVIISANLGIVLTKCRCDMNDTGTV